MKNMPVWNAKSAELRGYRPLTIGYQLPQELSLLSHTLEDMRRGGINHCLVESADGVAVWRSFRSGTGRAGQHLTPALSPARRGSKNTKTTRTAQRSVPTTRKGKRS